MPVSHTNRRGQVYYLHQGRTKTGKPRYHFSQKAEGDLAEAVPEGFEVYETPNGQVFLRKFVPRETTPEELRTVEEGLRRAGVKWSLVEAKKDCLIVHTPSQSEGDLRDLAEKLAGPFFGSRMAGWIEDQQRGGHYHPMLRFVLCDKESRCFSVQRWCFRGSIDGWTWDLAAGKLGALVAKYAPHLGKESFYDLM